MELRAAAWVEATCPFIVDEAYFIGGRIVIIKEKWGRLIYSDDAVPSIIWVVRVTDTDGVEFTVSERSMPTVDNPQN